MGHGVKLSELVEKMELNTKQIMDMIFKVI